MKPKSSEIFIPGPAGRLEGKYYKMRFIDFYYEVGEKGFPKIEIQKL